MCRLVEPELKPSDSMIRAAFDKLVVVIMTSGGRVLGRQTPFYGRARQGATVLAQFQLAGTPFIHLDQTSVNPPDLVVARRVFWQAV